ncbi:MAG TPA: hypothetical protein VN924_27790 [Bryobacteraceae bacterium]|jgi:N-acyl-D-amino-acid deacylase|nr:hypothetical protein [Bryobacteraceae bacterium]
MGINLASYVGATQCTAWCWAMPTTRRTRQSWSARGHWYAMRCAMARWACRARCNTGRLRTPTTEELIALAAAASKSGGIYATHMRSEGDAIVPALDEAIRIGPTGGLSANTSRTRIS